MAVVRCDNGHFYDDSLFESCPHCRSGNFSAENDMRDSVTVKMQEEIQQHAVSYIREKTGHYEADFDDEKTIALVSKQKGNDFVAGWLVCVKGPGRGREYSLYHGFNRIGRGMSNDVCIAEDKKVPRETQCSVVYENKKNVFFAVPQGGCLSYLNGKLLEQAESIVTGDTITVGDSDLTFVAFCEGDRRW